MGTVRVVLLGSTVPLAYAALERLHKFTGGVLWPDAHTVHARVRRADEVHEVECVALGDPGAPDFAPRVREADALLVVADPTTRRLARLLRVATEVSRARSDLAKPVYAGLCIDQPETESSRDLFPVMALLPAVWLPSLPRSQPICAGGELFNTLVDLFRLVITGTAATEAPEPYVSRWSDRVPFLQPFHNPSCLALDELVVDERGPVIVCKHGAMQRLSPSPDGGYAPGEVWSAGPLATPLVPMRAGHVAVGVPGQLIFLGPEGGSAPPMCPLKLPSIARSIDAIEDRALVCLEDRLLCFEVTDIDTHTGSVRVRERWDLFANDPRIEALRSGGYPGFGAAYWLDAERVLLRTTGDGWLVYDGRTAWRTSLPRFARAVHVNRAGAGMVLVADDDGVSVYDRATLRARHTIAWPGPQSTAAAYPGASFSVSRSMRRIFARHSFQGALVLDAVTGAVCAHLVSEDSIVGAAWLDEETLAKLHPSELVLLRIPERPNA